MFIIYTTCGNKEDAKKISMLLIKARLAVCVQMFQSDSIFLWKGKINKVKEVSLFIKTDKKLFGMIEALIRRVSGYDMPCIFGWEADKVSMPYKNWLNETLGGKNPVT